MATRDQHSRYRNMTTRLRAHKTIGLVEAVGIRMSRILVGRTATTLPNEGDELDILATRHLKTPFLWWTIADQNSHLTWPLDFPKNEPVIIPLRDISRP